MQTHNNKWCTISGWRCHLPNRLFIVNSDLPKQDNLAKQAVGIRYGQLMQKDTFSHISTTDQPIYDRDTDPSVESLTNQLVYDSQALTL